MTTAPITLTEYNKDPAKANSVIGFIVSNTIRSDNPAIKAQANVVNRGVSSFTPAQQVTEINKLIALIDNAIPSSTADDRNKYTEALGSVTTFRQPPPAKPETAVQPPATKGFSEKPGGITNEKWVSNHNNILAAARSAISSLGNSKVPDIQRYVSELSAALAKSDSGLIYTLMGRLEEAVEQSKDPLLSSALSSLKAVAPAIRENRASDTSGKSTEAPPKAAAPPPKPTPAAGKLCEPITHERWGVRFRFLDKPPELVGKCESKGDVQWDLKDWFLQLLPAMQSIMPKQGARDVPNAGPGLSFRFKNNMVKHKIPGSQPVYQMMGVDSAIITFVGTFTGDGGLGYINKVDVENGELAENAARMMEREAASRRAGEPFIDAKKYGGTYPYGKKEVNAMFNPIYHVRNRATAPGGDASKELVGGNSSGWLMDNSILRQGFFERDGCPGQCPPPGWGGFPNGQMDVAGGKFAWGDFGKWPDGSQYGDIGTRSQMDTHKLAHIAAYLDAYHEMVSFYKFAVQAGKLMEITINLRKTHDGLKPRIADPRMKGGGGRSDTPDPLRDMHTGNPTFKGYLRTMSTWAQYSDRVWYVMEFEVVDHGLQGKKAVNLTNKVSAGGASSSGKGDGTGDTPGSPGSDDSKDGTAAESASASANISDATKTVVKGVVGDQTITARDGEILTLRKDGTILSGDKSKVYSYREVLGKLSNSDIVNTTTLNKWFDSNRVLIDKLSVHIRIIDGTSLMLNSDGKLYEYDKGTPDSEPLPKEISIGVLDSPRVGDLTDAQRGVISEWRSKVGTTNQVVPVPSTTSAPVVPRSTPTPLIMMGPIDERNTNILEP